MPDVDDAHVSVRLKHGIHTIYLFVDSVAPFSDVTKELIELLQDRYPEGLTTSLSPPRTTKVPSDAKIAYGVLNVPNDPSRGWKKLNIGPEGSYTATKVNLKQNSIVAFQFVDDEDEEVLFEVEWPKEDEEMYDQAN